MTSAHLYIDCVHTPKGTMNVVTKMGCCLHHNLSRMVEVALCNRVDELEMCEAMLSLYALDESLTQMGLERYDIIAIDDGWLDKLQTIHDDFWAYLESQLGKQKLVDEYNEILLSRIFHSVPDCKSVCLERGRIGNSDALSFRADSDKAIMLVVINDENEFTAFRDLQLTAEEFVKKLYPSYKTHIVYLYNLKQVDNCVVPDSIVIFDADDFCKVFGLFDQLLLNFYYYCEDRRKNPNITGNDIDLFAYYINNKHTFYQGNSNDNDVPHGYSDNYILENLRHQDAHLVRLHDDYAMVSHFDEFPVDLPVYQPKSEGGKNMLVGELMDSVITMIFDSPAHQDYILTNEIAKSLFAWMIAAERRFNSPILSGRLVMYIEVGDAENILVMSNGKDYKFSVPREMIEDPKMAKYLESTILKNVLDGLVHFKENVAPDYLNRLRVVFSECDGHLLQVEPHGDMLLTQDGERGCYYVNERCCDVVLDEIADYINRKGKEVVLNTKESGKLSNELIDFLLKRIDALLSKYATTTFVQRLLQLEHGLLYWQATNQQRYDGIQTLFRYIGSEFSDQVEYKNRYMETSNLTRFLIERILRKDIHGTDERMVLSDLDMLYAYAHQCYTLFIYMDTLNTQKQAALLTILPSGRIAFPLDKMSEIQSYFGELNEQEFEQIRELMRMSSLIPEYEFSFEDEDFKAAFEKEFGIAYSDYIRLLNDCMTWAIQKEKPVVTIREPDFRNVFVENIGIDYDRFKRRFMLCTENAKGLKYLEFAPHRHNRKFQFYTSPWVLYNGDVMYSYKALYRHLYILNNRIEHGNFRAESDEMRKYLGAVNEQKGKVFNNGLYALYKKSETDDMFVAANVEINKGATLDADDNLGDIDLLLIKRSTKQILCIELKNYRESRAVWDCYNQAKEIEDDLVNVLRRDKWCKKNVSQFAKVCKNGNTADFVVSMVFMTYNKQTLSFCTDNKYPEITFLEVIDIINNPESIFEKIRK